MAEGGAPPAGAVAEDGAVEAAEEDAVLPPPDGGTAEVDAAKGLSVPNKVLLFRFRCGWTSNRSLCEGW
jgi:hypothetical protein